MRAVQVKRALGLYGGPFLVAVAFLMLSVWSWRKWPDVLVDFGRELYVPWQLGSGKILYKDIAYLNGPFSPYLNAIWFKLFGVSLSTLIFCNLAILATTTGLLYWLLQRSCDRFTATMSCLVFLSVFAFSQYIWVGNYNFVTPYSHELTHGTALALLLIFCLSRFIGQGRFAWALLSGFVFGLLFLTKPEVFLAAAGAVLAALLLNILIASDAGRQKLVNCLGFGVAALLPASVFFVYMYTQMTATQALEALGGGWSVILKTNVLASKFYERGMGFDKPEKNLIRLGLGSGGPSSWPVGWRCRHHFEVENRENDSALDFDWWGYWPYDCLSGISHPIGSLVVQHFH